MNDLPLTCTCPTAPIPDVHTSNIHMTGSRYYLIHAPGCPLDDNHEEDA